MAVSLSSTIFSALPCLLLSYFLLSSSAAALGYAYKPQAVFKRPNGQADYSQTEVGYGVQRLPGLHR